MVPSTRSTFHAGRVWPNGGTTPLNACARPSQLMNVPAVSQMLRLMAHKARKLATSPAVWEWEDAK